MKEMGWSYPDLMAAPPDLVEEILYKMNMRAKYEKKRKQREDAINGGIGSGRPSKK